MDEYKSLRLFELVPKSDVPEGTTIHRSLWAYKLKVDADGRFQDYNPRWCLVGTNMDRSIYRCFNDVARAHTVKILFALRAADSRLIDLQLDECNAFGATRTDTGDSDDGPPLFCQQAPGFAEVGPNGEAMACKINSAMQGRIDSARLHGDRKAGILRRLGYRQSLWDPRLFIYHKGALAGTDADLHDLVERYAPDVPRTFFEGVIESGQEHVDPGKAPDGWGVIAVHVDDGNLTS